jgi:hypothetical protein
MNDFEDDATKDDLDVEITDLEPIEGTSRISKVLMEWEDHPSLRLCVWRIATASGTLMLILLVIFSTFPSARNLASSFFSQLTPAHTIKSVRATATPEIS